MKRFIGTVLSFLIAVAVIATLVIQPLTIISPTQERLIFHMGKRVELEAIAEVAGGYKCYVKGEDGYFWLSRDEVTYGYGQDLSVQFSLIAKPMLIRKER